MLLNCFWPNQIGFEQVFDNLTFKRMTALRNKIQSVVDHLPNYFRGRKFRGQKSFAIFAFFGYFSRKFLPRHNLNLKFAKVFAREITENSQLAKVFVSNFLRFFKFLRMTLIFSLLGYETF